MDEKWPRAAIALIVFTSVVVGLTLLVTQCTAAPEPEPERPAPTQLDVVSYAAPVWAGNRVSDCWLVQDRQLHHDWWLMKLDGEWVTLDAGEVSEP